MLFPIGGRCDPHFLFEAGAEIILIGITTFQAYLLQTHSSRSQVTGGCGNPLRCDKVTETDPLIFLKNCASHSRYLVMR